MRYRRSIPLWLGKYAKQYYSDVTAGKTLTFAQRESYAVLSDAYETYRSAQQRLQELVNTGGGYDDNTPEYKLMKSSFSMYLRLGRELGVFHGTSQTDYEKARSELDELE